MSDETVTAPAPDAGQATVDTGTPTPSATPAAPSAEPSGQAPTAQVEDTFFDPSSLAPELQTAYKNMQASYTRKMQQLSKQREEFGPLQQLRDNYAKDPFGVLQQLAQQAGYTVTPRGQSVSNEPAQEWVPQTWEEVRQKAVEDAEKALLQKLSPQLQQLQKMQAQSIESQLDGIDPSWRDWEDQMMENLRIAPHLANDISRLYEISMPKEVRETRAMQAALKKMRAQLSAGSVESKSTKTVTTPVQSKAKTFDEAAAIAKAQLAAR